MTMERIHQSCGNQYIEKISPIYHWKQSSHVVVSLQITLKNKNKQNLKQPNNKVKLPEKKFVGKHEISRSRENNIKY